jgi:amino acid adenylation domain-containing protein
LYVIHTSGSTGQPKAVVLPHQALSNLLAWQTRRPGFEQAARTLQYASLSFDVHHQEIFPTWASGGTLVLIDQELRQDLPALVRFISEQRIERLWMPFAALQPSAEIMAGRTDLEFSLQQICTSGEQLQVTPLIRQFFLRYPAISFHNEYGPSEAHVVSIYDFAPGAKGWAALPPIGKPVPNTQLYILDQHLQPCAIGVPGELYIGGCQLALGYLNQPEETAAKFIANPHADTMPGSSPRLYKTGDLARYLADGNISYLGRADDQVKFRGFRIEPGEIETALSALPGVKLAAVLLREDHPGDKRLVGYITAEPGSTPDVAALRSQLLRTLPEYMVPAPIMVLDSMPVTPSGKLSRRDLPVPELTRAADSYTAPRNPTETKLTTLFSEILKIEKVGIHDDFFALGGHSLLATQFVSRVRDVFSIELPLKYVFRHPSAATLAEQISAMQLTSQQIDIAEDDDDLEEFEI